MNTSRLPIRIQEDLYSMVCSFRERARNILKSKPTSVEGRIRDLRHWARVARGMAKMYSCNHEGDSCEFGTYIRLRCESCDLSVSVTRGVFECSTELQTSFPLIKIPKV